MSELKPETLCIIIAGCPENIGLVVEVIGRIGATHSHVDAYKIRTVTGNKFAQFWADRKTLVKGSSHECITERHKLRPLVEEYPLVGLRRNEVIDNQTPIQEVVT